MTYGRHTIACAACKPRESLPPASVRSLAQLARAANYEAMLVMPGTLTSRQLYGLVAFLRSRVRFEVRRNRELGG